MKLKIKHIKILLKLGFFKNRKKLNKIERKVIQVFNKYLSNPNSVLLIAPIKNRRYMQYRDIFIIIAENSVKFSNHVYHYDLFLNHKIMKKLTIDFDLEVESRREKMENEILQNKYNSLKKMLVF
jgi:hypothetical protein